MTDTASRPGFWRRIAPALTLVFLAPMIAEVLPGATRLSVGFVFPIEMGFWGCGALLARAALRHWQLGWKNLVLLAVALSLIEELLVQQTSLAPLVIQIVKGAPYGRAFGVNWIYLVWALGYESVLVVLVPVMLCELIFPSRRAEPWLSGSGLVVSLLCMGVASFFAWFSWVRYARPIAFHMPPYAPPAAALEISAAVILVVILLAIGPTRRLLARSPEPMPLPSGFVLGAIAAIIAVLWYGLVLLAFRLKPDMPPGLPVVTGIAIILFGLYTFPHWAAGWSDRHRYAVVFGAMLGSMAAGFAGFIGSSPLDLYGKAVLDALALVLLAVLAFRIRRAPSSP